MYDYIIVGAGMAGLYITYKLNKMNYNVICLEKNDHIGGRTREEYFNNIVIKTGAGVTDKSNVHLLRLLNKFEIEKKSFKNNINHDFLYDRFDMDLAIDLLLDKYYNLGYQPNLSVKDFLINHFGCEFAKLFFKFSEFSDYYDQNISDFIHYYPIDDVRPGPIEYYSFKYTELSNKLSENINIMTSVLVEKIERKENHILVNDVYKTKNIIYTGTIDFAKKLFSYPFLKNIHGVPFVKIFLSYEKKIEMMHTMLTCDELKKIIKLNDNTLMVYGDNIYANIWKKRYENGTFETKLKRILRKYELDDYKELKYVYWNVGIHCYTNYTQDRYDWIIKNMNPENNIFFCGEMMSLRQGWVEGAIMSVDTLIDKYIE